MSGFNRSKWQQRALTLARTLPYIGPRLLMLGMRFKLRSDVLTLEKINNFILANFEADNKTVKVKSLPYILNLDTVNGCNLRCPFCVTGTNQLERKRARFPTDKAKELIDKMKSHVLVARFHNWGEPFLNKEIFEIIRYAKDAGIHTTASSNLSVNVENLAEKILDSGLDHIHVSIDGLKQDTLETYRRKADIDVVLKNIRDIVELKKKRSVDHPRMELTFLVFKHNEHEISKLEDVKKELGVESFVASNAFIYHESFVPENPEYQPSHTIWKDTCHYLYSELMVEADGAISPCCTNTSSKFDVGHVSEVKDMHDFWNKPVFQAMRNKGSPKSSQDDTLNMETLCDHCNFIDCGETPAADSLSPLPPAMNATGEVFKHGLDKMPGRV